MLTNKNTEQDKQYFQTEFKDVAKETLEWLENIAWEYRCKIEKKEWKSKYNNYVIYDYEPFCADGFEINLTLASKEIEYLNFVRFLYDNKIHTLNYLKNCLSL